MTGPPMRDRVTTDRVITAPGMNVRGMEAVLIAIDVPMEVPGTEASVMKISAGTAVPGTAASGVTDRVRDSHRVVMSSVRRFSLAPSSLPWSVRSRFASLNRRRNPN